MTWAEVVATANAIRSAADGAALPISAIAWATVEADRAFLELAAALGDGAWRATDRDALLGAARWVRDPRPPDEFGAGIDLFVVEPDTEGRLAAFLARFGEGVAAVYLKGPVDRIESAHPRWGPFAIVRGPAR